MKAVALAIVLGVVGAGPAVAQRAPFKVIVHRSNQMSSIPVEVLSDYFLKKKTEWPGGVAVKPVDLDKESRIRTTFSEVVHNKHVSTVRAYWERQVFLGGMVPPPEAPSDVWVLAYIAQNPGAVGYVSLDAPLGPATRILEVVKVFTSK